MTAALGVKLGPFHDTGASVVYEQDGELRCIAIGEERLRREKQCRAFPERAIAAVMDAAGLTDADIGAVVVDKQAPGLFVDTLAPVETMEHGLFGDKDHALFGRFAGARCLLTNHHLAHAATAWHVHDWPASGEPGAVLVVDGAGTHWPAEGGRGHVFADRHEPGPAGLVETGCTAETQTLFRARGRSIERLEVSTLDGIGHFYSWVSKHIARFGHLQEGKLMGLAGWGTAEAVDRLPAFPRGVFAGVDTPMLAHVRRAWGGGIGVDCRAPDQDPTDASIADAAFWAQHWLTEAMLHLAGEALARTGTDRLALAGGVALNVVANRIVRDTLAAEGRLRDMYVQPAASDSGVAMGCALLGYYHALGGRLPFQANQVYLGPEPSESAAEREVIAAGGRLSDDVIADVADLLLDNRIVGWWQGRSEHGPRALGARSILCWPRGSGMKDHLNARVKHREAFRPFAPIVAEERLGEVFDNDFPVPYMLFNTHTRPGYRDRVPAVTHVDGSARLQTVAPARTPRLHALLAEVHRRDGVGVLLNTSFNDAGEPIVESASDALSCFRRTGLDAVVCGRAILRRAA